MTVRVGPPESGKRKSGNLPLDRLKTMPLKFSLSFSKLPPGEYCCQVTILEPTTQKAAFWQSLLMLVP